MIEYKLITGLELNEIDPQGIAWPLDTFAVVAYEGGKVVGRLAIRNMPVVEGWYVDPDNRDGTISDELVRRVEDVLKTVSGATHAACLSYDNAPSLRRLIHAYGYEDFPVKLHIKELVKGVKAA